MAEDIKAKLENYRTAPFDARFPNQNQTRNCWSNYLGKAARQGQSGVLCFPDISYCSERLNKSFRATLKARYHAKFNLLVFSSNDICLYQ